MGNYLRHWIPLIALFTLAGCSQGIPTDAELRLAAKSELRKLKRPETEQDGVDHGAISKVECKTQDRVAACSFRIGSTDFRKAFARTGSGAWSAYER